MEGQDPLLKESSDSRQNPIHKCYLAALRRGYQVFAVQHGGQCFSGPTAHLTYSKYGPSNDCEADDEGGPGANQVYNITGWFTRRPASSTVWSLADTGLLTTLPLSLTDTNWFEAHACPVGIRRSQVFTDQRTRGCYHPRYPEQFAFMIGLLCQCSSTWLIVSFCKRESNSVWLMILFPRFQPFRWVWLAVLSQTVRSRRHHNGGEITGPRTPGWSSKALEWSAGRGMPGNRIPTSGCRWTLEMWPGWRKSTHRGEQPRLNSIAAGVVTGWRNTMSPTAKTTSPSTNTNTTD